MRPGLNFNTLTLGARAWLLAEARWYAEWADNAGLPRYVMLPWKKARDARLRTEDDRD